MQPVKVPVIAMPAKHVTIAGIAPKTAAPAVFAGNGCNERGPGPGLTGTRASLLPFPCTFL